MGCFSIQQGRRRGKHGLSPASPSAVVHPSLRILKELGLSSHLSSSGSSSSRNKGIIQHCHAPHGPANPYTRATTALRSASSKLVRHHSKALPSSSFRKTQSYSADREQRGDLNDNAYAETSIVSHSAPIPSSVLQNEDIPPFTHLFPLPLPPMAASTATTSAEEASSQSVSSTSSASSSSSCSSAPFSSCSVTTFSQSYKSYINPLGLHSASTNTTFESKEPLFAQPLPLPPALEMGTSLREFSYDELAGACLNFAREYFIRDGGAGPVFKAMVRKNLDEEDAVDIAVTRLSRGHLHSFKKWRAEVGALARLSHPNICKVLGFSREDPSPPSDKTASVQRERLLVYEHTSNGSLDNLLYGRKGRAPLDWGTRSKIALGAAQGLAFLHERTPRQIVYKSFKTLNIQVDHDFDAKLSDYGFAKTPKELPFESPARFLPSDDAYAAPETRSCSEVTAKSNVWSFGIVLLELLTGRQNMDAFFAAEERNLLQWCRPYLLDSRRLYLVMDPELKGRYSTRKAKTVADLALQCLAEDPAARPSMRDVVTSLLLHVSTSTLATSKLDQAFLTTNFHKNRYTGEICSSYMDSSIKSKYSKSCSLASVLASPARSFTPNSHSSEPYHSPARNRIRLRGFLSEEITRESCRSLMGSRGDHPFLSQSSFLSAEVMGHESEVHMHRSSSSAATTSIRAPLPLPTSTTDSNVIRSRN